MFLQLLCKQLDFGLLVWWWYMVNGKRWVRGLQSKTTLKSFTLHSVIQTIIVVRHIIATAVLGWTDQNEPAIQSPPAGPVTTSSRKSKRNVLPKDTKTEIQCVIQHIPTIDFLPILSFKADDHILVWLNLCRNLFYINNFVVFSENVVKCTEIKFVS